MKPFTITMKITGLGESKDVLRFLADQLVELEKIEGLDIKANVGGISLVDDITGYTIAIDYLEDAA
jgi:hypothetical protein